MSARAKDGTGLAKLVQLAIPIVQAAERQCPRMGPGRPPEFDDWKIATLIIIAILKQRKSKSAQYRFLHEHRHSLRRWLPLPRFPSRSTYFDRYRRAYRLFQIAVALQGRLAIHEGWVDATCVAVDKSLLAARGRVWHRRNGRPCKRPAGTDGQAGWGCSDHGGWVYGYSYEVIVSAPHRSLIFPLLASAGPASESECRSFGPKISWLPIETRHVLADRAYDANAHGEALEYDATGRPNGRRLVCPLIGRAGKPKVGQYSHRGRREQLRQQRQRRLAFFESPRGQQLYARRSRTVEPFHEWFKSRFDLHDRVWHRGLDNNRTQLLTALFVYQLLVRYNHYSGYQNGQIQWILDRL
jgi:hypothetical protein